LPKREGSPDALGKSGQRLFKATIRFLKSAGPATNEKQAPSIGRKFQGDKVILRLMEEKLKKPRHKQGPPGTLNPPTKQKRAAHSVNRDTFLANSICRFETGHAT